MSSPVRDKHSFSNSHNMLTTSIHLDLRVDFEAKVLRGWAEIEVQAQTDGQQTLVLDSKNLDVQAVKQGENVLKHELGEAMGRFGQPLRVTLPDPLPKRERAKIRIDYITSPSAYAIQWLEPEQTRGKMHPFLFTQCQSIHARSFFPCQDTPSVKAVYSATIRTPNPLVALMSAHSTRSEPEPNRPDNSTAYHFRQDVPVPSYLVALAVGDLHSVEIGPRTKVWAEKEIVEAAAYEFTETEEFLKIAEAICGPYVWGRYDLLVLPPSFPYGGMENPMLTFVTPTLIAGDRSMVNVVAHEIAHSWTGNLVTNANWEHFWLNEGFTVFVERKILERKYGRDFAHFHAREGRHELDQDVEHMGRESDLTSLSPDLQGVHPDDAFSGVPYEKGYAFLDYLENLLGGPAIFEPYLRAHLERFKYITVTTPEWRTFFEDYFIQIGVQDKLAQIDWDLWLRAPGMPPEPTNHDLSLAEACDSLAQRWVKAGPSDLEDGFKRDDITKFSSLQVVVFLNSLQSSTKATRAHMEALDRTYGLSANRNSEIRFAWLILALSGGYQKVFPQVVDFVTAQGRMKYVCPLYRSLFACGPEGKALAHETFQKHRGMFHNIAAKLLEKDVGLEEN